MNAVPQRFVKSFLAHVQLKEINSHNIIGISKKWYVSGKYIYACTFVMTLAFSADVFLILRSVCKRGDAKAE